MSRLTTIVFALTVLILDIATAFAQATPRKDISQQFTYNDKHQYIGLTIHIGGLSLTVQSDEQNTHLKAGNMPALVKRQDVDGRDVEIATETGEVVAEIGLNDFAHPEKITLGKGVKFMVLAQSGGRYKQTLFGPHGKVFGDRLVDPTSRRAPAPVFLEPVAADLGLSPKWREEIDVETDDSLLTVRNKATGKLLLYVVRSGPDRTAFLPDGTPFFYDVQAQLYVGRAKHTERYGALQSVVPDRFIYTRDGRIGAYVWTPANTGIASFWTEKDASGATLVHFSAGESATNSTGSPHAASAPDPSTAQPGNKRETTAQRRSLRPGSDSTYSCETTQTCYTTDYGDSGCWPPQTTCYCTDCTAGGVGTCAGLPSILNLTDPQPECASGGSTSGSSGSNQISGNSALSQDVANGLTKATDKLTNNQQCIALLSSLTTTSPQSGGTPLQTIMNQRSFSNPAAYINSGVGFYYGQTKTDSNGNVPCNGNRYAWTVPTSTQVWVCDKFDTDLRANPGMEGNILIHEMLHTLGLPEGGTNQYTNQQITDLVANACGN